MKEKREALTNILMTLMEQQKKRAAELQKRMDEMEGPFITLYRG